MGCARVSKTASTVQWTVAFVLMTAVCPTASQGVPMMGVHPAFVLPIRSVVRSGGIPLVWHRYGRIVPPRVSVPNLWGMGPVARFKVMRDVPMVFVRVVFVALTPIAAMCPGTPLVLNAPKEVLVSSVRVKEVHVSKFVGV